MAVKKEDILNRYMVVVAVVFTFACAIMYSAFDTVFVEGDMWRAFAQTQRKSDVVVKPDRGNIYSSDGQLMASSVPRYLLYLDMKANGLTYDTLKSRVDSMAWKLSKTLGTRSPNDFKRYILSNYGKTNELLLSPQKVSYTTFKKVTNIPNIRLGWNLSVKKYNQRQKPFGTLASRTIGDIYSDESREGQGKNGFEAAFDSILRGKPGKSMRVRTRGRWEQVNIVEPEHGMDLVTTINTGLQDIAEKALVDKLVEIDAEAGLVILMEVKTGKVRAIVNMEREAIGRYQEVKNRAIADLAEPGSTFKVASMMVMLEDNPNFNVNDTIDVGNGIYTFYGAKMNDHNIKHGGYHRISYEQAMWYSSNVGVSRMIFDHYKNEPSKYVEGLYKIGLNKDLHFEREIPGAAKPWIKHPKDGTWSAITLPWMSIGYETMIPPIYTLTFYNAIANGGKMIRPYFIESFKSEGSVVQKFGTEVVNSSICSDKTLIKIQEMLNGVVQNGTASAVKSPYVSIAGKTGTAQISRGALGYRSGGKSHQVSFCGYFPVEEPEYTCLCVIRGPRNGYPSGGTMSGGVVRLIAEQTYARTLERKPKHYPKDSIRPFLPIVKGGALEEVKIVMNKLDIDYDEADDLESEWVKVSNNEEGALISGKPTMDRLVPNVIGMAAKDAVYLLERAGLNVIINGKGGVTRQSIAPGSVINKGTTISLTLK